MLTVITIHLNSDDNGLSDFVWILSKVVSYVTEIPEADVEVCYNHRLLVEAKHVGKLKDFDNPDFITDNIAFTFHRNNLAGYVDIDFCIPKLQEILSK